MPSYYLYVCTNGHEERRYRNARKCRTCGAEIDRRDAPTPDKTTLERYVELRDERPKLLAEIKRLSAPVVITDKMVERAAMAMHAIHFRDTWESRPERAKQHWMDRARAAVEAALKA